MFLVIYRKLRN